MRAEASIPAARSPGPEEVWEIFRDNRFGGRIRGSGGEGQDSRPLVGDGDGVLAVGGA